MNIISATNLYAVYKEVQRTIATHYGVEATYYQNLNHSGTNTWLHLYNGDGEEVSLIFWHSAKMATIYAKGLEVTPLRKLATYLKVHFGSGADKGAKFNGSFINQYINREDASIARKVIIDDILADLESDTPTTTTTDTDYAKPKRYNRAYITRLAHRIARRKDVGTYRVRFTAAMKEAWQEAKEAIETIALYQKQPETVTQHIANCARSFFHGTVNHNYDYKYLKAA